MLKKLVKGRSTIGANPASTTSIQSYVRVRHFKRTKIDNTHRNAFVSGKCVLNAGISDVKVPPESVNIVEERKTSSVLV